MRTLKILIAVFISFVFTSSLHAEGKNGIQYLLIVNIQEKNLVLYAVPEKERFIAIESYPIAAPINNWLPLPLLGEIKKIENNPWWHPTKATQIAYLNKRGVELPNAVPPNSSQNAMGKVKIIIQFENFNAPIRIHGTNEPNSIGRRASRGCIRMLNEDIIGLTQIIKNEKTKVIIR